MEVELIDKMGTDLTVVNAARVSFDKHSDWESIAQLDENGDILSYNVFKLKDADVRLIKYLARHNHFTPFAHPQLQMRITAPIFVARQLFKHKVGLVENEISRRYVDTEPTMYLPEKWHLRAADKKQGCEEAVIVDMITHNNEDMKTSDAVAEVYDRCFSLYYELLRSGVAPEEARMVLPLATYTSWYWTGSLAAFYRVYSLRSHSDAQLATREIANKIGDILKEHFPVSYEALCGT